MEYRITSQLNVDTIVDKAGSGGSNVKMANTSTHVSDGGNVTQNTVQGLAKAWFNGSTAPAVVNSFNISSVTDNDTGQFFFNYTNPMSDGNTGAAAQPTSVDHITITLGGLTAMMRCYCFDGSAYVDTSLTGTVCGDLA